MGDELWQRFQRAEKEVEAELRDVVEEVILYTVYARMQEKTDSYLRQMHCKPDGVK